jgi:hypothetical protein
MDRSNVAGHDGTVHQALLNSRTAKFIDVACDAGRYAVVRPYEKLDQARLTNDALTCPGCTAAVAGDVDHPADVARRCADAVLADADRRGYPASPDDEALRQAFVRLAPTGEELRPVFERLARGVYDPENDFRTEPLYALIREHLADALTARALDVADPIPGATARYTAFTGGDVVAPLAVGDRVMRTAYASGLWWFGTITGTDGGTVLVCESGHATPFRYQVSEMNGLFAKLDRAPVPAAV